MTKFSFAITTTKEAPVLARAASALPFDWDAMKTSYDAEFKKGDKAEHVKFSVPVAFWSEERGLTDPEALEPDACRNRIKNSFANWRKAYETANNAGKLLPMTVAVVDQYKDKAYTGCTVYAAADDVERRAALIKRMKAMKRPAKKAAKTKKAA